MGGPGSGRHLPAVKTTVEECVWQLDLSIWYRRGAIRPGAYTKGVWSRRPGAAGSASVGFEVDARDPRAAWYRLFYRVGGRTAEERGEVVDERAPLVVTKLCHGGVRFWFTCPGCGRRVRKLYLPPGRRRFRCRHCCDLTYRSCRESHSYDRVLLLCAPELAKQGRTAAEIRNIMRLK